LARRSSWLRSAGARGRENGSVLPEAGIGTADATVAIVDAAVVGFVMVVDDEVVITGSFNFTKAAEDRNAENPLVIRDRDLAAKYTANCQAHDEHAEDYTVGKGQ